MQYCFDIENPESVTIDPISLKNHIKNLYKDQFDKEDEDLPFITIYAKSDKSVCILMTGRSKKNLDVIEVINNALKPSQLNFKGLKLSKPYIFDVDTCTWWDNDTASKSGKRWNSMTHRGPYFKHISEPYTSMGSSLTYEGKKYRLTPGEEQVAAFYASRLISEKAGTVTEMWTKNPIFNKNYFIDFVTYLTPEHRKIFKNLKKIGWGDLIQKIEENKPAALDKKEKRSKRVKDEERKREYGYSILDGKREKVGNFTVEPASIFMGRGKNPNAGRIKRDVIPEDVTINIGSRDPIPKPPPGHEWGAIIHDQQAEWLARWKDTISGEPKYVRFSAEGKFKGECDFVKYEKARKLEKHITTVRKRYMSDVISTDVVKRQLGTVLYLIDHFGLRVGGEKGEDETDTVGASTLRIGHITLKSPDKVIFDFLGKDSIRYYKVLEVPAQIYENFTEFIKGPSVDNVFDQISAKSINEYLKQFDRTFTAKVFRTRLASVRMFYALQEIDISDGSTKQKTKVLFNKANAEVADILNHTRTMSQKAKEGVKNLKAKLLELKQQKKEKRNENKSTKGIDKSIESTKAKIEDKANTMNVAITTSLTNYIDPRIVIAWSEIQDINPDYIYSATLMKKFTWAMGMVDSSWDYIDSPLSGPYELNPKVEDKTPVRKTPVRKKARRTKTRRSIGKPSQRKKISYLAPGTLDEWKTLLAFCHRPEKHTKKLPEINKDVLRWLSYFSQYAIDKGISKSKANEYLVKFYNMAYKA